MFQHIEHYITKKNVKFLLFLLFVLMPFGSSLISLSLGFMTIYPSLIILFVLTIFGFVSKTKIQKPIQRYTLVFYVIWITYAIIQTIITGVNRDAIIDIRSLILMTLYAFVLFWTSEYLNWNSWKKVIKKGVKFYFFLLLIFSFVEFQGGIHIAGHFTEKLELTEPGLVHYSPLFIYDNPNNVTTYIILLGLLLILLEKNHIKNLYKLSFYILSIYFIAFISASRIGIAISISLLIYACILAILKYKKSRELIFTILVAIMAISLFLTKQIYYTPIWQPVKKHVEEKKCNKDKIEKLNSIRVRKHLALNGIEALKESHFLGVGPGQFRVLNKKHKFKMNTETNIGLHFWAIEILSQFGIFIFIGYLYIIFHIILNTIKNYRNNKTLSSFIIISLIIFGLTSLMPSIFLSEEINWIFIGVIIVLSSNFTPSYAKEK